MVAGKNALRILSHSSSSSSMARWMPASMATVTALRRQGLHGEDGFCFWRVGGGAVRAASSSSSSGEPPEGPRVPTGGSGSRRSADDVERLRTLIEGPDPVGGGTLTTTQKVVEGAKSASFGLVGFGFLLVGAGLVYLVASHLMGASSPGVVFSKTCSLIKSDPRVLEAIGTDVRCYGEGTRGKDMDFTTYVHPKDKREHLRLRFYAEGSKENAEVICDIYSSSGQYASVTVHVPYTGTRLALTADGSFRIV